MKLLKVNVFLLILVICAFSCSNEVATTMQGWWTIDTLRFNHYGDIRGCISNSIFFNENQSCNLPYTRNRCESIETFEEDGKWDIIYTDTVPVLINITTGNRIFKGIHEVYFYRDDKEGLLKMAWVSDSLYMICRKGMYNIDLHVKTVNNLIELTNNEWEKEKQ